MVLPTVVHGGAICETGQVRDGQSVKFRFCQGAEKFEAFLVCHEGRYYAWRNQCAHLPLPLDLGDNDFFTLDSRHLICRTHAAVYEPASGECISGPCAGKWLIPVEVEVRGNEVVLRP